MKIHEYDFREQILNIALQTSTVFSAPQLSALDVFLDTEEHFTAAEFADRCRKSDIEISDNESAALLETLCLFGSAQKHIFSIEGRIHVVYEHLHIAPHHDHFTCVKCGAIEDFRDEDIEDAQSRFARAHGFTPLWHRMILYGICSNCMGKRERVLPLNYAHRGEKVTVSEIRGGDNIRRRLADMGIIPGMELEVINNGDGPMLLSARGSRVALGAGMAAKIYVTPA